MSDLPIRTTESAFQSQNKIKKIKVPNLLKKKCILITTLAIYFKLMAHYFLMSQGAQGGGGIGGLVGKEVCYVVYALSFAECLQRAVVATLVEEVLVHTNGGSSFSCADSVPPTGFYCKYRYSNDFTPMQVFRPIFRPICRQLVEIEIARQVPPESHRPQASSL